MIHRCLTPLLNEAESLESRKEGSGVANVGAQVEPSLAELTECTYKTDSEDPYRFVVQSYNTFCMFRSLHFHDREHESY